MASPEEHPIDDDPLDVPNRNPESYCRFCFSNVEIEPLYEARNQPKQELLNRVYECIGIRLTDDEDYPSSICWMCSLSLEEFQCFRDRCRKYDEVVRRVRKRPHTEPGRDVLPPFDKLEVVQLDGDEPHDVKPNVDMLQQLLMAVETQEKTKLEQALQPVPASVTSVPKIATAEKTFKCPHCPRKFSRKMYLVQHQRKHINQQAHAAKLWKCHFCPLSFTGNAKRQQHEFEEHLESKEDATGPGIRCSHCPEMLPNGKALSEHVASCHPKQKPSFRCHICPKTFKYRYSLHMHVMNHEGKLPFSCDQCDSKFHRVHYLNQHKARYHGEHAIHPDTTRYACPVCARTFLRDCDRKSHITMMHSKSDKESTQLAAQTAKTEDEPVEELTPTDDETAAMMMMMMGEMNPSIHEPVTVIKEENIDEVLQPADQLASTNVSSYYCDICDMSFDTEDMFMEHLDDQHSRKTEDGTKAYKCPYCPKSFTRKWSMQEHVRVHYGGRRFPCEMCNARFSRSGYLRAHKLRTHGTEKDIFMGNFKCRFCSRLFLKMRYRKVHESVAHIKKGEVLPEDATEDSSSQMATLEEACGPDGSQPSAEPSSVSDEDLPEDQVPDYERDVEIDMDTDGSPGVAGTPPPIRDVSIVLERLSEDFVKAYQMQLEETEQYVMEDDEDDEVESSEEEYGGGDVSDIYEAAKKGRKKLGIKLHTCVKCMKVFKTRKALEYHAVYHSGSLPFTCEECGVQFMRIGMVRMHKQRYHGSSAPVISERFQCNYCPRIFLRKQDRANHHLSVHPFEHGKSLKGPTLEGGGRPTWNTKKIKRKEYLCRECGRLFENERNCQRHIAAEHPRAAGEVMKPMKLCGCAVCVMIFKKRDDWNEHLGGHPNVRPHHCELCLRKRRKKYGRKKMHKCTYCPKVFTSSQTLKGHTRIHTQELRFPCTECNVMYDRYRDLASHKQRYHSEDAIGKVELYKCQYCPRAFTRQRDINWHQNALHSDIVRIEGDELKSYGKTTEHTAVPVDADPTTDDILRQNLLEADISQPLLPPWLPLEQPTEQHHPAVNEIPVVPPTKQLNPESNSEGPTSCEL